MCKIILVIDIGSSATKASFFSSSGELIFTVRQKGTVTTCSSISTLTFSAIEQTPIDLRKKVVAIGITSQVGSYIPYLCSLPDTYQQVFRWQDAVVSQEASELISKTPETFWVKEIGMPHPKLASYPAVFLLNLKHSDLVLFSKLDYLLSVKDYLYYLLTGVFASDSYTWRGLANANTLKYSSALLKKIGFSSNKLPRLYAPSSSPGRLKDNLAKCLGFKTDIPVFLGCNDFYAGLLGMGIDRESRAFDLTGTSEHVGIITPTLSSNPLLIASKFFDNFLSYGVNASSGTSLDWGRRLFGNILEDPLTFKDIPIFLPYIDGERTPIYSPNASGVFFGIKPHHDNVHLSASVVSGVAYSMYHIWSIIPEEFTASVTSMSASGGGTQIPILNQIKSDILGIPYKVSNVPEGTSLGVAKIVARQLSTADKRFIKFIEKNQPTYTYHPNMQARKIHLANFKKYEKLSDHMKLLF